MAHKHSVYDTDMHFAINPITRTITNKSSQKTLLIQYDHNSERFTFEIPRFVDGHDMSICNVVEIHYLNIDASTKVQNAGVYEVEDLQISPNAEDEDVVILSWLISQNATQLVGSLNFLVRFACMTGDEVDYVWNTAIFTGIAVSSGIFNSEIIVEQYADVLEQWRTSLGEKALVSMEQTQESDEVGGTNVWTATFGDGRTSNFRVKNGSKGDKGDTGEIRGFIPRTYTLHAGGWYNRSGDGYIYELAFPGMTPTACVICSVAPNKAMEDEVNRCMVRCGTQEEGYLWFRPLNGQVPTIDIEMNILVVDV